MTPFLRAGHALLCAAVIGVASPACYTAGNGTPPPMDQFYFPTALTVSAGGNVLYVVNSDFDLQWNGGTLQSYDLWKIRHDTQALIAANIPPDGQSGSEPPIPFLHRTHPDEGWPGFVPNCLSQRPSVGPSTFGISLQQGCSPPVDSTTYVRDSAIVGAFATDLQLSNGGTRLLTPISGNATVTWADIAKDDPMVPPSEGAGTYAPFNLDCGLRVDARCDGSHAAGNDANQAGNTRNLTMPGEPFGMAQSQDGTAIAVTSETDTKTSLLTTGYPANGPPTMQFVLDGVPTGGVAIAPVPHDPDAVSRCEDRGNLAPCVRQAFLQTSRSTSEVDLDRYYSDDGAGFSSSLHRPFLVKERAFSINSNLGGTDFRGIAIDPTPRLRCKQLNLASPLECGRIPARVFIASRTPPTLVVGQIGLTSDVDGTYDPDAFKVTRNIPLPAGPSKVYLAPVVVPDYPAAPTSHYELRVFVVLFDSSGIAVINPDLPPPTLPEEYIATGPGPFALAFDPFDLNDVAAHRAVPVDSLGLHRYRFAYVASFTQSFMQVIDLEDSLATKGQTYEKVVFNLGGPSYPKGQAP